MSACKWCKVAEAMPYPRYEGHCSLQCLDIRDAVNVAYQRGRDEERAQIARDLWATDDFAKPGLHATSLFQVYTLLTRWIVATPQDARKIDARGKK